jgi:hypothetical protein
MTGKLRWCEKTVKIRLSECSRIIITANRRETREGRKAGAGLKPALHPEKLIVT